MTRALLIQQVLFWIGFAFLIVVAIWTIVTITRMKRDQAIALGTWKLLAAQFGLKDAVDTLHSDSRRRRTDLPPMDTP